MIVGIPPSAAAAATTIMQQVLPPSSSSSGAVDGSDVIVVDKDDVVGGDGDVGPTHHSQPPPVVSHHTVTATTTTMAATAAAPATLPVSTTTEQQQTAVTVAATGAVHHHHHRQIHPQNGAALPPPPPHDTHPGTSHLNGYNGLEYPPPPHHPHHHHDPATMIDMGVPNDAAATASIAQTTSSFVHPDGEEYTGVYTRAASDDTENEGSTTEIEEDPLKLFVGQVPKQMSEEDIFPTFDTYGPLKDVAIIRDKHTGLHRGCAFVTYWSASDAQRAQQALHDNFTFPGARRPAQVKPAEPSVPENKLFIGMLSRSAGEDDVRELFEGFGEIREIHMIRLSDGTSRCAAFLRFVRRDSATKAIGTLNNSIVMEGAARPLIVKFADSKHQRQQRHLRNIRKQEMMSVAAAGVVPTPYQTYQGSAGPQLPMVPPSNPGASPHAAAAVAGAAYHHATISPHHPSHHQFPPPPYAGAPPYMYPHHAAFMQATYGPLPHHPVQQQQDGSSSSNPRPREGPAGANLFVYHLPHDLTDADLATAFNSFGNVISAKVYVDKFTGESKGFGFVSYDSVISAEAAIEQMNGFQIGNKRLKVQHKRVHGMNPNLPVHRSNPTPSVTTTDTTTPATTTDTTTTDTTTTTTTPPPTSPLPAPPPTPADVTTFSS